MSFTLEFVAQLGALLIAAGPLVLTLLILIAALAVLTGRIEGWGLIDSLYYGFVTATTVGFGDMRPSQARTKLVAIAIAFLGLMMTGMTVALAVEAMDAAYDRLSTEAARDLYVAGTKAEGMEAYAQTMHALPMPHAGRL